eukprot:scaffold34747_cov107-Isochrysis_galbana.AAC.1
MASRFVQGMKPLPPLTPTPTLQRKGTRMFRRILRRNLRPCVPAQALQGGQLKENNAHSHLFHSRSPRQCRAPLRRSSWQRGSSLAARSCIRRLSCSVSAGLRNAVYLRCSPSRKRSCCCDYRRSRPCAYARPAMRMQPGFRRRRGPCRRGATTLCLMRERALGPASDWAPYLRLLPKSYDTLENWSQAELHFFAGHLGARPPGRAPARVGRADRDGPARLRQAGWARPPDAPAALARHVFGRVPARVRRRPDPRLPRHGQRRRRAVHAAGHRHAEPHPDRDGHRACGRATPPAARFGGGRRVELRLAGRVYCGLGRRVAFHHRCYRGLRLGGAGRVVGRWAARPCQPARLVDAGRPAHSGRRGGDPQLRRARQRPAALVLRLRGVRFGGAAAHVGADAAGRADRGDRAHGRGYAVHRRVERRRCVGAEAGGVCGPAGALRRRR